MHGEIEIKILLSTEVKTKITTNVLQLVVFGTYLNICFTIIKKWQIHFNKT